MLQFMDDFTSYGTDASNVSRMLNGVYADANVSLIADPDPAAGGKFCLQMGGLNNTLRKVLTAPQTTIGVAARYWLSRLPVDTTKIPVLASFRDINNNIHIDVTVNPSGYIEVYRQDTSAYTMIGQSSAPVIIANAWRHIETKAVIDATAGSVVCRIEGTTVLNLTNVRTTSNVVGVAASAVNVALRCILNGAANNFTVVYVKDFIIWDGTGSVNNTFMGSCQVYKIIPDGDDSFSWTPSSGSAGWSLINETTPDDDTNYISAASPAPAFSRFTMTDLPVNVTSVRGVMPIHRSRKIDGGDGNIQVSLVSGANTGNGADRAISTAYTYWWDIFDTDPGGGSWTKALVDALKVKINRTL